MVVREEIKKTIKAIREARLVGCVREQLIIGHVVCPLIEICPYAPKDDVGKKLHNNLSYSRLSILADTDAYDEEKSFEELVAEEIEEIMKLLEKAKEITEKCPLRKTLTL